MHLATVIVGAIIAAVGALLTLTGGVIAGFDLLSLAGCGAGSTCLYGFGGATVGGIVFIAGLSYLVRGFIQPATPNMRMMPQMMMPPGMAMMGAPVYPGSVPTSSAPATPSGVAPGPVVFCSACGTANVPEATFCHRCGKPIARPGGALSPPPPP